MDGPAPTSPGYDDGAATVWLANGVSVAADDLRFSYTTASGPGWQNVNRRSTRVSLRVAIDAIPLHPRAKARLRELAGPARLVAGDLIITDGRRRSQRDNKRSCVDRLGALVRAAMPEPKVRRPTKPSRRAKARRMDEKTKHGQKKRRRRGDDW